MNFLFHLQSQQIQLFDGENAPIPKLVFMTSETFLDFQSIVHEATIPSKGQFGFGVLFPIDSGGISAFIRRRIIAFMNQFFSMWSPLTSWTKSGLLTTHFCLFILIASPIGSDTARSKRSINIGNEPWQSFTEVWRQSQCPWTSGSHI